MREYQVYHDLFFEKNSNKAVIISEDRYIFSFVMSDENGELVQKYFHRYKKLNDLPAEIIAALIRLAVEIDFIHVPTLREKIPELPDRLDFAIKLCKKHAQEFYYIQPEHIKEDWMSEYKGFEFAFETMIPYVASRLGYIACPQAAFNLLRAVNAGKGGLAHFNVYYFKK